MIVAAVVLAASTTARPARRGAAAPPQTAKAAAAIDLTGTWVSVISEDWPQRMLPLRKGDYTRIPLTPAARKVADTWDPARDEAAGELCKGYTAAGITRMPGRIRLSWQDDYTMKMELEAGNQTRLFHFRPGQPPAEPSWQGYSVADWQYTRQPPRSGELRVMTNRIRPGLPAQERRALERQYHRDRVLPPVHGAERRRLAHGRDGSHGPENLQQPYVQSSHFKKLPDGAAFKPEPCSAR